MRHLRFATAPTIALAANAAARLHALRSSTIMSICLPAMTLVLCRAGERTIAGATLYAVSGRDDRRRRDRRRAVDHQKARAAAKNHSRRPCRRAFRRLKRLPTATQSARSCRWRAPLRSWVRSIPTLPRCSGVSAPFRSAPAAPSAAISPTARRSATWRRC